MNLCYVSFVQIDIFSDFNMKNDSEISLKLNSFYQLDTRYFHLSGKFEWLIHYLLLVMNDFVFLNPLKCQFCTICDIFLAFNMENNNEIALK